MAAVVYFVKDLLFSSKIRAAAKELGLEVEGVREPQAVAQAAAQAKLVIVDLRSPQAMEVLDQLQGTAATSVGFVDHENVALMDAASAHGCQKVMTKGRFTSELPLLLSAL